MALKDEWKQTGKGLGNAFSNLGKTVLRSMKDGIDVVDNATDANPQPRQQNVFNDGSWRNTGRELESALTGLGKSILHSAKAGLDKIDPDEKK